VSLEPPGRVQQEPWRLADAPLPDGASISVVTLADITAYLDGAPTETTARRITLRIGRPAQDPETCRSERETPSRRHQTSGTR
jgi:hypothetical protein